jgi:Restriction endonuclease
MSEILGSPRFLPDWQAAEIAAVDHMKLLGFIDAQATGPGTDGGIDAASNEAVAQVKFYASPVGRPDVQRLRGAAHDYLISLFYSTGGYTSEAVDYANKAHVALFTMDPYGGCEPASDFARVLTQAGLLQERTIRLQELQAVRFRFAASALESELRLYEKFVTNVELTPEEANLSSHVTRVLESLLSDFRMAIETGDFERAENLFGEIGARISFLSWIAGPNLFTERDLPDTIYEGWNINADPGSDQLLRKAALGVGSLKLLIQERLEGWAGLIPQGTNPQELIDMRTSEFAGMLEVAARDGSLLSPELLEQLVVSVKAGVERGNIAAKDAFLHLLGLLSRERIEPAERGMVATILRVETLASRVLLQLEASTN